MIKETKKRKYELTSNEVIDGLKNTKKKENKKEYNKKENNQKKIILI